MKQLPVGKTNLYALIDDCDFEYLSKFTWYLRIAGTYRQTYRAYTQIGSNWIYMHQFILPNLPQNITIDHINNNGLDNQRSNLRLATRIQQQQNRRKREFTSSEYKGVNYNKATKSWRAKIKYNEKSIHLGLFKTEIAAAKAYNEAAMKYFGEFANINKFTEVQ